MPSSIATLVSAAAIVRLQDERTRDWHVSPPGRADSGMQPGMSLEALVEAQHATNFILWHAEDEARRPDATDASIAAIKREIDRTNQQRNDLTESMDMLVLAALGHRQSGEQHSETLGMMVDRLSILSLRLFHTREELERQDVSLSHRERNADRWNTLHVQRNDLGKCLDRLWAQCCTGERYFKLYRQLKMYNDPELNPAIYRFTRNSNRA